MKKVKTIKLSDGWKAINTRQPEWQVEQLTDSIEFRTGDRLTQKQVEELVASPGWKVTIVPNKMRA